MSIHERMEASAWVFGALSLGISGLVIYMSRVNVRIGGSGLMWAMAAIELFLAILSAGVCVAIVGALK